MATSIKVRNSSKAQPFFLLRHLDTILLLAFAFVLFFHKLGSYPLFDLDEPRYAEAAREMLEKHDWITPYFNYELRFDKPVFFYWLIALAYQAFGVSEFSARLFSAITGTLTVLSVYSFGKYWMSPRYGLIAGLILSTSALFIGISRMSITDMTLSFFMTATSLCLFMAVERRLAWWLAAGLFSGLAILTKGPVGMVIPGAILLIYALLTGKFRYAFLNRWFPLAIGMALAVAAPWYIAAYQVHGQYFLDALFLHNVTRFSDVVSGHQQPIYFYGIVLLAGFLPWTLYLPAAIRGFYHQARQHAQRVQSNATEYLLSLYAAVWIGFIFLFFTLGHTKLLTYILPLFPALALFLASTWNQAADTSVADTPKPPSLSTTSTTQDWRWLTWPSWAFSAIVTVGGLIFTTQMARLLPREAAGIQGNSYNIVAVLVLLAGALAASWFLHHKKAMNALLAQSFAMALLVTIALKGIIPNVSHASQGLMLKYIQIAGKNPIVLYEIQRPSLTFYTQRQIPRFVEEQAPALRAALNKNPQTYIITKTAYLQDFSRLLPPTTQQHILEKGPVYSLLSVRKTP